MWLVINSFSFCMFEISLLHCCFWRYFSKAYNYRMTGFHWRYCSTVFSLVLFPIKNPPVIFILVLYVKCLLSLDTFRFFPLIIIFEQLVNDGWTTVIFFMFLVIGLHGASCIWGFTVFKFGEFLDIFLQIFFSAPSLFLLWGLF